MKKTVKTLSLTLIAVVASFFVNTASANTDITPGAGATVGPQIEERLFSEDSPIPLMFQPKAEPGFQTLAQYGFLPDSKPDMPCTCCETDPDTGDCIRWACDPFVCP